MKCPLCRMKSTVQSRQSFQRVGPTFLMWKRETGQNIARVKTADMEDIRNLGEATRQFTSFFYYDHAMTLVLPLSQLSVSVATGWYEGSDFAGAAYDENGRLYEWKNTILPDVYIHQDIEDIRQGKNSALKWVLAQ